jgi:hypothetical protein
MLPASGEVQEKTLQFQRFPKASSYGEVVLPKVIDPLADYSLYVVAHTHTALSQGMPCTKG